MIPTSKAKYYESQFSMSNTREIKQYLSHHHHLMIRNMAPLMCWHRPSIHDDICCGVSCWMSSTQTPPAPVTSHCYFLQCSPERWLSRSETTWWQWQRWWQWRLVSELCCHHRSPHPSVSPPGILAQLILQIPAAVFVVSLRALVANEPFVLRVARLAV